MDAVFEGLSPEPPSRTFFPDLYDAFARKEAWRIYDDVIPALDALAGGGVRLGIISNWDERLRGLLCQFELDSRFEVIVVSHEAGFAKPSPEIFALAARELNLPAQAILHVGDSVEHDLQGGRDAGLQAVRILRRGDREIGDDTIANLGELTGRLGGAQ